MKTLTRILLMGVVGGVFLTGCFGERSRTITEESYRKANWIKVPSTMSIWESYNEENKAVGMNWITYCEQVAKRNGGEVGYDKNGRPFLVGLKGETVFLPEVSGDNHVKSGGIHYGPNTYDSLRATNRTVAHE